MRNGKIIQGADEMLFKLSSAHQGACVVYADINCVMCVY